MHDWKVEVHTSKTPRADEKIDPKAMVRQELRSHLESSDLAFALDRAERDFKAPSRLGDPNDNLPTYF